jgi:hypothetical protein
MCPSPKAPEQVGGINVAGGVGHVAGDIVGRDKITVNFGISFDAQVKLAAVMASLSERTLDRQRLAARWIVEIIAAVLVDEMRMLYVGASSIARRFNADRYSEFIGIAEQHIGDFNNQFKRYAGDLAIEFISKVRAIEQRYIWAYSRLKTGLCTPDMSRRLFQEMKITAEQMHILCSSSDNNGYKSVDEMIAEIAQNVWDNSGRPCGLELLDALWRTRLNIQSIFLKRIQEGVELPILTIADDMHQSFALAYFVIDRWLMQHGLPQQAQGGGERFA